MKSYVFGPVASRRLGRSLGIDLVPYKICPLDCIYCEVGKTIEKSLDIKEWVPYKEVLNELKEKLSTNPDYITIAGSGEPTLYSKIHELILDIKKITKIPIAVITNGVLLYKKEVRNSILSADLIMPSLDAGDNETFQKINQPNKNLSFVDIVQGLIDLRKEFKNKYFLEVFFIKDINDSIDQVKKIAEICKKINPDKILLNTIARPPAYKNIEPISKENFEKIIKYFPKNTEIIKNFNQKTTDYNNNITEQDILDLLKRRACTFIDIKDGLNIESRKAQNILDEIVRKGIIEKDGEYYRIIINY